MINKRIPDKKKARSIIEAAKKDMDFTLSLKASEESAAIIIRNIYECFRMLGEGLLIAKGIEAEDHIMQINELINLKIVTNRPLRTLDNLRVMRHRINYQGYRPTMIELNNAISIATNCFEEVYQEYLRFIK